MADDRKIIRNPNQGFFDGIANYLKLVWRLMLDRRVNPLFKVIPFFSIIYWINPFDIPFPIDDAAVVWMTSFLFIELSPPDVVAEHRRAIEHELHVRWEQKNMPQVNEEDIIDAEYDEE